MTGEIEVSTCICGQAIHRYAGSWWHSEHDTDHAARPRKDES